MNRLDECVVRPGGVSHTDVVRGVVLLPRHQRCRERSGLRAVPVGHAIVLQTGKDPARTDGRRQRDADRDSMHSGHHDGGRDDRGRQRDSRFPDHDGGRDDRGRQRNSSLANHDRGTGRDDERRSNGGHHGRAQGVRHGADLGGGGHEPAPQRDDSAQSGAQGDDQFLVHVLVSPFLGCRILAALDAHLLRRRRGRRDDGVRGSGRDDRGQRRGRGVQQLVERVELRAVFGRELFIPSLRIRLHKLRDAEFRELHSQILQFVHAALFFSAQVILPLSFNLVENVSDAPLELQAGVQRINFDKLFVTLVVEQGPVEAVLDSSQIVLQITDMSRQAAGHHEQQNDGEHEHGDREGVFEPRDVVSIRDQAADPKDQHEGNRRDAQNQTDINQRAEHRKELFHGILPPHSLRNVDISILLAEHRNLPIALSYEIAFSTYNLIVNLVTGIHMDPNFLSPHTNTWSSITAKSSDTSLCMSRPN